MVVFQVLHVSWVSFWLFSIAVLLDLALAAVLAAQQNLLKGVLMSWMVIFALSRIIFLTLRFTFFLFLCFVIFRFMFVLFVLVFVLVLVAPIRSIFIIITILIEIIRKVMFEFYIFHLRFLRPYSSLLTLHRH